MWPEERSDFHVTVAILNWNGLIRALCITLLQAVSVEVTFPNEMVVTSTLLAARVVRVESHDGRAARNDRGDCLQCGRTT